MNNIDIPRTELAAENLTVHHVLAAAEGDDIDFVFLKCSCFHEERKGNSVLWDYFLN
jgi:hypothetical protein